MDELKGRGAKTWRKSMILPEHQDAINAWYASQEDVEKPILTRDRVAEINQAIQLLHYKQSLVKISYYHDRRIVDVSGRIYKVDSLQQHIVLSKDNIEKVCISLQSITDIIEV